ncbi:hypothetical protein VTK73DRAFT_10330 [Phialemonium thermophilum]|uniref:Uncharacterized protein n=1 Tax=Phialemonium thermophilum TaxID=223376 RepID=A0ABR3VXA0_9PEZI
MGRALAFGATAPRDGCRPGTTWKHTGAVVLLFRPWPTMFGPMGRPQPRRAAALRGYASVWLARSSVNASVSRSWCARNSFRHVSRRALDGHRKVETRGFAVLSVSCLVRLRIERARFSLRLGWQTEEVYMCRATCMARSRRPNVIISVEGKGANADRASAVFLPYTCEERTCLLVSWSPAILES